MGRSEPRDKFKGKNTEAPIPANTISNTIVQLRALFLNVEAIGIRGGCFNYLFFSGY